MSGRADCPERHFDDLYRRKLKGAMWLNGLNPSQLSWQKLKRPAAHTNGVRFGIMQTHKFAVGQKVRFRPDLGQLANRDETFCVVRLLPEAAGIYQYEIKSEVDGHVRVVRESQLADL
jgi:hypothetical protein